jgi:hypothetical protein
MKTPEATVAASSPRAASSLARSGMASGHS